MKKIFFALVAAILFGGVVAAPFHKSNEKEVERAVHYQYLGNSSDDAEFRDIDNWMEIDPEDATLCNTGTDLPCLVEYTGNFESFLSTVPFETLRSMASQKKDEI